MRIAIMQPYLFPYLGYFQLIQAVDAFVVYDDVNYIKQGWINRNYILAQGRPLRITLSLRNASPNRSINEVTVGDNQDKLLKTIRQNYSRAPQFATVFPVIEEILLQQEKNLAAFLDQGLRRICNYLDLRPAWHISSSLEKDTDLRGQEKVLFICEKLGATEYINLPGGMALYDRERFARRNIRLSFIQPRPVAYNQSGRDFVPNLSIIDAMMFNDHKKCQELLREHDLV